ncbi:hypothetical protein CR983_01980 [Candidatus Saccharibacteria bacterium]|nr:MAG: hypothetical protein CR983_01980 [Candidatus Saccharibacteria bacterium]
MQRRYKPGGSTGVSNLLLGKQFTSSGGTNSSYPLSNLTDDDTNTRWVSAAQDNINLDVDMGAVYMLTRLELVWAGDTTKNYSVSVSVDGSSWTEVYRGTTGGTPKETATITAFTTSPTGRFLRITCIDRQGPATSGGWGHSMWEARGFGVPDGTYGFGVIKDFAAAVDVAVPSVALSWSYNGDPINGFVIKRDGATIANLDASATSYTDTDVALENNYNYTITAAFQAGNGSASATTTANVSTATRDPFAHPFTSTSPWNLGIKNNVDTTYDGTLFARPAAVNYETFSHCVVMGTDADPLVTCVDTNHGNYTEKWRIPSWVQPSYGSGNYSDLHMAIVNEFPDGSLKICEMFGCYDRGSTRIRNRRMAVVDLRSDGLGPYAGVRAWGGSSIGGLIRQAEIEAGEINHAIAIAVDMDNQLGKIDPGQWDGTGYYWDGSTTNAAQQPGWNPGIKRNGFGQQLGYVWPASEQDGFSASKYRGNIRMGTYYCIPSSVNIDNLGLNSAGLMVARAMQDYGVYVTDATSTVVVTYVEYFYGRSQSPAADTFVSNLRSNIGAITNELRKVNTNNQSMPNGAPLNSTDRRRPMLPDV